MASKAQKQKGFILPEQITGHELICFQMYIPNIREYRAAFIGQITQLGKAFSWEMSYQEGDNRASEAASYWRSLIEDMSLGSCEGGEVVIIPEFRTIDVTATCQQMQYRIPPDVTWNNLGDLICDGEQGQAGQNGLDGVCADCTAAPNENTGNVPAPPEPATGSNKRCQVAEAVSKYLIDNYTQALQEYTLGVVQNGEELLRFAKRIQTELPLFYLVSYLPTFGAWITSLTATSAADNYNAANAAAAREAIKCHLFTALSSTGDLTAAVYSAWMSLINADTSLSFRADLTAFMSNVSLAELRTEAFNAVTFNIAHDCDVCAMVWSWEHLNTACNYNLPTGWTLTIQQGLCGLFGGFRGIYRFTGSATATAIAQFTITPESGKTIKSIKLNVMHNTQTTPPVKNVRVQMNGYDQQQTINASYQDYTFNPNAEGDILVTITSGNIQYAGVACRAIEVTYE